MRDETYRSMSVSVCVCAPHPDLCSLPKRKTQRHGIIIHGVLPPTPRTHTPLSATKHMSIGKKVLWKGCCSRHLESTPAWPEPGSGPNKVAIARPHNLDSPVRGCLNKSGNALNTSCLLRTSPHSATYSSCASSPTFSIQYRFSPTRPGAGEDHHQ